MPSCIKYAHFFVYIDQKPHNLRAKELKMSFLSSTF